MFNLLFTGAQQTDFTLTYKVDPVFTGVNEQVFFSYGGVATAIRERMGKVTSIHSSILEGWLYSKNVMTAITGQEIDDQLFRFITAICTSSFGKVDNITCFLLANRMFLFPIQSSISGFSGRILPLFTAITSQKVEFTEQVVTEVGEKLNFFMHTGLETEILEVSEFITEVNTIINSYLFKEEEVSTEIQGLMELIEAVSTIISGNQVVKVGAVITEVDLTLHKVQPIVTYIQDSRDRFVEIRGA